MSTDTLQRSLRRGPFRIPSPPAPDRVTGALRAAQLAEISAETAEWIAADLTRREASGAGPYGGAARRIRQRAAGYREEARCQRGYADRGCGG